MHNKHYNIVYPIIENSSTFVHLCQTISINIQSNNNMISMEKMRIIIRIIVMNIS